MQGLDLVNTHVWVARTDTAQTRFLADLNDVDFTAFVQHWEDRNRSIAQRISAVAQASGAERVVVFYGYMNTAPVKRALLQLGHPVRLLEDL